MLRKPLTHILRLALLIPVLALYGCAQLLQPAYQSGSAPTPVISFERGGVDNPDVYVDPVAFQAALMKALVEQDTARLQMWMADPFLSGTWRGEMRDGSPAEALKAMLAEQPAENAPLTLIKGADLQALMGGKDPLSIPGGEAQVVNAFLVGGWGASGRDEYVLFITRQANNSLQWRGWMKIQGGFSGSRLGGLQAFSSQNYGFSFYLPKNHEVHIPTPSQVSILVPGQGETLRAYIEVQPANGRSASQVAESAKAEPGPGFNITTGPVLDIEGAPALVLSGLPGQDPNRQLFMVHNNLLYHITFMPDDPQAGASYSEMEDVYAMIVNTFHFLP